jgi:hypothetical protein
LQGCSEAKLCITLANKKAEAVKMRRKTAFPFIFTSESFLQLLQLTLILLISLFAYLQVFFCSFQTHQRPRKKNFVLLVSMFFEAYYKHR